MKSCLLLIAFITGLHAQTPCADLLHTKVEHTEIKAATQIDTGHFSADAAPAETLSGLPPFCRVLAIARPTADSEIQIETWLPVTAWSGRTLATGNGGFAGKISYAALAHGLKLGDAVANTDMGMAVPAGKDASVFIGRAERWRDWGYRSTHEMALVESALVRRYYGHAAAHSYFSGCSTGGEQALMEAQRFPDDYDGIVAGAPANNRVGVHVSILWNYMATHRQAADYIPQDRLQVLHQAVLAACDAQDGIKDGLISDPFSCHFDPGTLLCKAGETKPCLSAAQVETVREVYAGPIDPATRQSRYPGVPPGSELDWGQFGPDPAQPSQPPFAPIFQWVFGANWDWHTFNLNQNFQQMESQLAKDVNATDGNLARFKSRGGKLIAYHGLADWLVVPGEALRYRNAVIHETKGDLNQFYRLYLIPGMGHCAGGVGPNSLDALKPVEDWVEKGIAPETLVAHRVPVPTSGPLQRPICPYPQIAKYRGSGDPNDTSNFTCVAESMRQP
jgi:feruloyl esterase